MHPTWPEFISAHCPAARIERGNQVCFSQPGAGVCALSHLGVIRVEGEEAAAKAGLAPESSTPFFSSRIVHLSAN